MLLGRRIYRSVWDKIVIRTYNKQISLQYKVIQQRGELAYKRAVYAPEGKLENAVHNAILPDRFTAGIEFAYDYSYDMTEEP